jgi:hypothetical protein
MTGLGGSRNLPAVERPLVEPLAWDSEFFGFPIGRVDLDDATPESLAAIDSEARATGMTCLYGSLDPARGTTAALVQTFGHRLAPWSRYGADPRFGLEAARRMHVAWVERAARDLDERMLAVTEDETGVTGFSTNVRSPVPRVDIMGVTKLGSGASWALMAELVEWADGGPIDAGPCAARNIAPLRFLEHCGFSISRVRYLYHRWLDEDTEVGS